MSWSDYVIIIEMEISSNYRSSFEPWQQAECNRLGITIDQHNQLLEISGQTSSALGGVHDIYQDITDLIVSGSIKEFVRRPLSVETKVTKKSSIQIEDPKCLDQKRYKFGFIHQTRMNLMRLEKNYLASEGDMLPLLILFGFC